MSFSLKKTLRRPIALLKNWHNVYALIDTGALFPVWVAKEHALARLGAKLLIDNVEFGGFGGKVKGKLYKLPYFQLGELIYPNLHIILCEMDMPCQMILSATMFHKLRYEIDDENGIFNVTIPENQSNVRNLIIEDRNGKLHVLCTEGED